MPAISAGSPQRLSGTLSRILSPMACAIPAVILLGNGPGAIALAVMLRCEGACQVVDGSFARSVGIGAELVDVDTVDRSDIDDPCGIFGRGRCFQQRQQGLGQEERPFDIDIHDLVPAAFRKLLDRRAPGCAGIVHENIETGLTGLDRIGKRSDALGRR